MMLTWVIDRIREKLGKADGLLIFNLENLRYLIDFNGHEFMDGVLMITKSKVTTFFTDQRYSNAMQDKAEEGEFEIYDWSNTTDKFGLFTKYIVFGSTILIEDVAYTVNKRIKKAMKSQIIATITKPGIIGSLRVNKTPDQIASLRSAGKATDTALEWIMKQIKPGMTEKEVRFLLNAKLRELSLTEELSFGTIVGFGPGSADPHHETGSNGKKLRKNDIVLIDCGAIVNGYCGDSTHTFFVGKPNRKLRDAYLAVKAATEACCQQVMPGMTGREVFWIADAILKEHGFGGLTAHGLGHGVGLLFHEDPYLSKINPKAKKKLEESMCFTIEPGLYFPGLGGIRLERSGVLTKNGFDPFNTRSFDLVSL